MVSLFKIKIKKWIDELIWCPSQCYGLFKINEDIFTLYLRWRHCDPWQGHLVYGDLLENSTGKSTWSGNLFIKYNKYFKDEDIIKAKKCLINLANKEINNYLARSIEDMPFI